MILAETFSNIGDSVGFFVAKIHQYGGHRVLDMTAAPEGAAAVTTANAVVRLNLLASLLDRIGGLFGYRSEV